MTVEQNSWSYEDQINYVAEQYRLAAKQDKTATRKQKDTESGRMRYLLSLGRLAACNQSMETILKNMKEKDT